MYGEKILQTFGESGKSGKSSFTNLLLGNTECNSRQGVSRSKSMTELGVHNPEASKTSDKLNDKHECYDTFKYLDVDVRSHKKELRQIRKELLMKKNMFKQKTLTVNIADVFEGSKRPSNSEISMAVFASSCEAIKGMLAVCEQDFPKAPLLEGHLHSLLFAQSVDIFTEYPFRHHFDYDSKEKTQDMALDSVIKTIKQTNTFSIIVIGGTSQASCVEALQNAHIRNVGVLIVDNTEEKQVLSNVFISKTNPINIKKDVESLLERCAFGVLATVYYNLKRFRKDTKLSPRDEANIQDLFDLIKSSFESSGIPPEEMPDIPVSPDIEYTANSDEIMQTITAIKGVIVCFNKRGMLQIYVHQSEGVEDIKEHIRVTLDRHNLKEYNISYGKSLPLAQCASGDSVCQAMGTLGGFVKKVALPTARVRDQRNVLPQDFAALSTNTNGVGNVANGSSSSDTHAPTTAALVSRHVVQRMDPPVLIVDSIQTPIGRIAGLPQITENDIFPIDVDEACKKLCDTRFKTELNESMYSKLRKSGDIRALRGKPVHIWGAKSTPGYGILVEHDARAVNELRINIRDRRTDEPFAQQGDSGAMVCYFDPRHEILYAVAMLINAVQLEGEETHRRYTAQILDDALQKLSIVNGCQFLLFEDETETSEYE